MKKILGLLLILPLATIVIGILIEAGIFLEAVVVVVLALDIIMAIIGLKILSGG